MADDNKPKPERDAPGEPAEPQMPDSGQPGAAIPASSTEATGESTPQRIRKRTSKLGSGGGAGRKRSSSGGGSGGRRSGGGSSRSGGDNRGKKQSNGKKGKSGRSKRRAGAVIKWGPFWDWAVILGIGAALVMSLIFFGGSAAVGQLYTNFILCGVLVAHGFQLLAKRKEPIRINPMAAAFFPFLGFVAYSFFFILEGQWLGVQEFFRWIQFTLLFWIVVHTARKPQYIWALVSMVVLVAMLAVFAACYKYFIYADWSPPPVSRIISPQYDGRATGFYGTPNLLAGMMLVAAPMLFVIGFLRSVAVPMRLLCVYMGIMCLFTIGISISRGAYIAIAVVLLMLPFYVTRKVRARVLSLLGVSVLIFATVASVYFGNDSIRERIDDGLAQKGEWTRPIMWRIAYDIFQDNPVVGTGPGSYEFEMLPRRPDGFSFAPNYAHSEYLNFLSDYGIVGTTLFFAPLLFILISAWWKWRKVKFINKSREGRDTRMAPLDKPILGGILLAYVGVLLHAAVDFHFKSQSILLCLAVFAGIAVARVFPGGFALRGARVYRMPLLAVAIVLASFTGYQGYTLLHAEEVFNTANSEYKNYVAKFYELRTDTSIIDDLHERVDEVLIWNSNHAEALSLRSNIVTQYYYSEPGRIAQIGRMAESDARAALALYEEHYLFNLDLARALQMQGRPQAEIEALYLRAIALADQSSTPWYYYAFYLSFFDERKEEAMKAVQRALELDPDNTSALSLRQKLLIP